MKNTYTKLRTKLEMARIEYPDDAAFKNRAVELLIASMKGAQMPSAKDRAHFIVKWTYKVDEMLEMLQDMSSFYW